VANRWWRSGRRNHPGDSFSRATRNRINIKTPED
jgi:hypothetical protein